jgi:DNA-directed RNA polymerase specialized sigma24 family protein
MTPLDTFASGLLAAVTSLGDDEIDELYACLPQTQPAAVLIHHLAIGVSKRYIAAGATPPPHVIDALDATSTSHLTSDTLSQADTNSSKRRPTPRHTDIGHKTALLVGISEYPPESGLSNLTHAADDAAVLSAMLEGYGFGVHTITNSNASRDNLRVALEELSQYSSHKDSILFYFAGHGYQHDGVHYLATFEASNHCGLPVHDVEPALSRSQADVQIMMLDACHSASQRVSTEKACHFMENQHSDGTFTRLFVDGTCMSARQANGVSVSGRVIVEYVNLLIDAHNKTRRSTRGTPLHCHLGPSLETFDEVRSCKLAHQWSHRTNDNSTDDNALSPSLGRYQLVGHHDTGGRGDVFSAWDNSPAGLLKNTLTEEGKQLLVDLNRYQIDGKYISQIGSLLKKVLSPKILSPKVLERAAILFHGRDLNHIRDFVDGLRVGGQGLFTHVEGTATSPLANAGAALHAIIKADSFNHKHPAPCVEIAWKFGDKVVEVNGVHKPNWDHLDDWLRFLGHSHQCFDLSDDRTFEDYLGAAKRRVLYALPEFRGENEKGVPCSLPTLLYRLGKTSLLDVLKRKKRRPILEDECSEDLTRLSRTNSDAVVVVPESMATVLHDLGLDDEEREIMRRVFDGERSKDIAADLKIHDGTVRSAKKRILDKLAKTFRGEGLRLPKIGKA